MEAAAAQTLPAWAMANSITSFATILAGVFNHVRFSEAPG